MMHSLIAAIAGLLAVATSTLAAPGTLVVLNKSDDDVSVIDEASGEVVRTVEVGNAPHEAAIGPDGRWAVVCDYGDRRPGSTLSVIDLAGESPTRTIDLGEYTRPHGIVWTPDGERVIVTAEGARSLIVVDVAAGEVERAIGTASDVSHMVAMTPDGERAFVANIGSGTVTAIDLERGERLANIETGAGAEGVAVRPGSSEVWVTNRAADTVTVLNVESLEILEQIECGSFPIRIAFTPDGATALVSNARSGDVAVIDAEGRAIAKRIDMNESPVEGDDRETRLFSDRFGTSPVPIGILVRPDGEVAYVANTNADVVTVIDLERMAISGRLRAGREPDGMAWTPRTFR